MKLTSERKLSLEADAKQAAAELESGRPADALETLRRLAVCADESPEVTRFHASLAMAMAQCEEALALLKDLARILPGGQNFVTDRAMCLIGLDRLEEAEAVLDSADFIETEAPTRLLLLARIAARRGDLARAAGLLKLSCGSNRELIAKVLKRPLCAAILCSTDTDGRLSRTQNYN